MAGPSQDGAASPHRSGLAVAGYAAFVLAAALVVIGPHALGFRHTFMAWHAPFRATPAPGDHAQTAYYLWLWEDALRHLSHAPWHDVYQLAATGHATNQPFGWPLVLVSVPVSLLFGPVAAYNVLVLLAFVGCALAAAALVRVLGASRPAAAVAGMAYAFAPFRLVQATSHINALLAPLLPLALYLLERALRSESAVHARRWGLASAAAWISIFLSGELHLALFSALLLGVWVVVRNGPVRRRARALLVPAAATALLSGVGLALQFATVLHPSVAGEGRSQAEAATFAPRLSDFIHRQGHPVSGLERYAYPGLVIAVLAVAGAVVLVRRDRALLVGLTALIGGGVVLAVVPGLVGHPLAIRAYRHLPFLGFSRVPGRAMVLVALALACLAGFAIELVPRGRWAVALIAAALICVDVPAHVFAGNAGQTAAPGLTSGESVIDLPAFDPGHFSAAGYALGITRAPGPRVGGYTPFATAAGIAAQAESAPLSAAPVDPCAWKAAARRFSIDRVVVHRDLYGPPPLQWDADVDDLLIGLRSTAGFAEVGRTASVVVFALDPDALAC
jgi:hypothetical protein